MRISPISNSISYKGNLENSQQQNSQKYDNITMESIIKEAQDRYVKEHQELYEKWQKLVNKPQRFTKQNFEENDKKQHLNGGKIDAIA